MPPTGAARGSLPFDAVTLKGLLHITSVIRPWNPPHLTRRITHVMCPGDIAGRTRQCGGGHNSPFPAVYRCGLRPSLAATGSSALSAAVPERIERRQRSQQPGAGAAAVPGVMERGQRRAAERVRARPARWPGRRRRPSENARPAAAAAVVRGWGAGAASANGGAVGTSKG